MLKIEQSKNCDYDYLRIFDGDSDKSEQKHSICGTPLLNNIRSSTNKIFIRFRSDLSVNTNGFMLQYSQSNVAKTKTAVKKIFLYILVS